jgi:hypothetical protein
MFDRYANTANGRRHCHAFDISMTNKNIAPQSFIIFDIIINFMLKCSYESV